MTYQPDLYDVVTPSTLHGDVDWYCREAQRSGGPVLELGAGTGRVTLPIAAAGVSIHALDSDARMLARLQSKLAAAPVDVQGRITVVAGDMRSFDVAERFALVLCPFLTFMAQHAGPLAGVLRWTGTSSLPSGGWVIQSEANRYDTVAQVVDALHRYEVFDVAGRLERTSVLRLQLAYLYPADIRRLLESSGFTDITISGGFDGRAFTEDGQELVVQARRDA